MKIEDLKKIVVVMGGPGAERDVSISMGKEIATALRESMENCRIEELEVHGKDLDLPEDCDLVFNALPGTYGEDGQMQAQLEARGIPYTGTDSETSRLAFDKVLSKKEFERKGVPTPKWQVIEAGKPESLSIPIPIAVKPPRDGSSVGVSLIRKNEELEKGLEESGKHTDDGSLLVEEFITGKELTVGIIGGEVLPVIEIRPKEGFYDYKNKYTKGRTEYLCPAPLEDGVSANVQRVAMQAYHALGIQVYARVDLLLDGNSRPWILEINTIPGMTETSLLPKAAAAVGMDFPTLCRRIIELSLLRG